MLISHKLVLDSVEVVDKETGEISTVKPDIVKVVSEKKFKTNYDNSRCPAGDDEVNNGEYLVDESGYCDLETLYARSIRQGVVPYKLYEAEHPADVPLDLLDKVEDNVGVVPETPTIGGTTSPEVSPTVEPTVQAGETQTN